MTFDAAANSAYKPVFSITEDLKKLGQQNRLHLSGHWLGAAGAAAGRGGARLVCPPALCTARTSHGRPDAVPGTRPGCESADYAWRQIPAQLEGQPAQLSALYLWTRRSRKGLKLTGLGPRLQAVPACLLRPRADQRSGAAPTQGILVYAA